MTKRKAVILIGLVVLGLVGIAVYSRSGERGTAAQGQPTSRPMGGGFGGPGFGGGFGGPRMPMPVELAPVSRADVAEHITIVGNLTGAATVDVVPKTSGRLESIVVRLGDPVRRGQVIAQVEDREIREQVKQAEASFEVAKATIRQREADLKFSETNVDRSRSLFNRQLLPKQTLDDAEARYQAAQAQLDLAQAQFQQAQARLDELRINLANTNIVSPVDGFVGSRRLDPGAFVSQNSPVASVVDMHLVRIVANVVEKDLRRIHAGLAAEVEVDAFPGEKFTGRVARMAPVLDPSTRTAQIELEIPNPGFRLKPGMYGRVSMTVDRREKALVVPRNALLDVDGKRGVFVSDQGKAKFLNVETGLEENNLVEVTAGLRDGDRIVTTGAGALREGDQIVLAGAQQRGGGPGRAGGAPGRPGGMPPGRRPPGGEAPQSRDQQRERTQ